MTHPLLRILLCAAVVVSLVPVGCGEEPTGPTAESPNSSSSVEDPKDKTATGEVLSEAEARKYLKRDRKLHFPHLKTLGPAVAEILAKHEYGLAFDALERMDNSAAEALAKCESSLDFEGLTELTSPAIAKKLAGQGGEIRLPKVRTLTEPVIQAFCTKKCHLYLGGLVVLKPEEAQEFAKHEGVLSLPNLVTPDDPMVLVHILGNKGPLVLGSVMHLGNPVAPKPVLDALTQCQGSLCLNGLKKLDKAEAEAIRDRTARTDLNGLQVLDMQTAIALRDCKSVISLKGIRALNADVVKVLLQRDEKLGPGLVFDADLPANLQPHERKDFEDHPGLQFTNEWGP